MLVTVCDVTWNVLDMQHIIPSSKRWDYLGVGRWGITEINPLIIAIHRMSFHKNLFEVGQVVGKIPWFRPRYGENITFVILQSLWVRKVRMNFCMCVCVCVEGGGGMKVSNSCTDFFEFVWCVPWYCQQIDLFSFFYMLQQINCASPVLYTYQRRSEV